MTELPGQRRTAFLNWDTNNSDDGERDDEDDDDNDDDDGDEIKVLCQVEVTSVSLFFINSCTLARLPRAGLSVR